jgi:hypothetical protein
MALPAAIAARVQFSAHPTKMLIDDGDAAERPPSWFSHEIDFENRAMARFAPASHAG